MTKIKILYNVNKIMLGSSMDTGLVRLLLESEHSHCVLRIIVTLLNRSKQGMVISNYRKKKMISVAHTEQEWLVVNVYLVIL